MCSATVAGTEPNPGNGGKAENKADSGGGVSQLAPEALRQEGQDSVLSWSLAFDRTLLQKQSWEVPKIALEMFCLPGGRKATLKDRCIHWNIS